jgi:hypothetical protein
MTERRLQTSLTTAQRIWRRDGWHCKTCGTDQDLVVDHVIPLSLGGTNEDDNLQTLCGTCNTKKAKNERRPQQRRILTNLRISPAGLAALDELSTSWSGKEGARSEVMRCLLAEAISDEAVVERAKLRYLGAHNRLLREATGM